MHKLSNLFDDVIYQINRSWRNGALYMLFYTINHHFRIIFLDLRSVIDWSYLESAVNFDKNPLSQKKFSISTADSTFLEKTLTLCLFDAIFQVTSDNTFDRINHNTRRKESGRQKKNNVIQVTLIVSFRLFIWFLNIISYSQLFIKIHARINSLHINSMRIPLYQ